MARVRTATAIIWSTVVSAGAMLATPACGGGGAQPVAPRVAQPPRAPVPPAEPIMTGPVDPIETLDDPVKAPPPAVSARVSLTVESVPAGAEVYAEGELRGTTPLVVELAQSETPITLRITADGYTDKELTVKPAADAVVQVSLVKAKRIRGTGTGKATGRGFVLS